MLCSERLLLGLFEFVFLLNLSASRLARPTKCHCNGLYPSGSTDCEKNLDAAELKICTHKKGGLCVSSYFPSNFPSYQNIIRSAIECNVDVATSNVHMQKLRYVIDGDQLHHGKVLCRNKNLCSLPVIEAVKRCEDDGLFIHPFEDLLKRGDKNLVCQCDRDGMKMTEGLITMPYEKVSLGEADLPWPFQKEEYGNFCRSDNLCHFDEILSALEQKEGGKEYLKIYSPMCHIRASAVGDRRISVRACVFENSQHYKDFPFNCTRDVSLEFDPDTSEKENSVLCRDFSMCNDKTIIEKTTTDPEFRIICPKTLLDRMKQGIATDDNPWNIPPDEDFDLSRNVTDKNVTESDDYGEFWEKLLSSSSVIQHSHIWLLSVLLPFLY